MYVIAQNHENTYILYIFLLREMPPSRDMLLLIYGHSVLLLCEYTRKCTNVHWCATRCTRCAKNFCCFGFCCFYVCFWFELFENSSWEVLKTSFENKQTVTLSVKLFFLLWGTPTELFDNFLLAANVHQILKFSHPKECPLALARGAFRGGENFKIWCTLAASKKLSKSTVGLPLITTTDGRAAILTVSYH